MNIQVGGSKFLEILFVFTLLTMGAKKIHHAGKLFISKVAKDSANKGLTETEHLSLIKYKPWGVIAAKFFGLMAFYPLSIPFLYIYLYSPWLLQAQSEVPLGLLWIKKSQTVDMKLFYR